MLFQIFTDFENFADTFSSKFAIKWLLKSPPHLKQCSGVDVLLTYLQYVDLVTLTFELSTVWVCGPLWLQRCYGIWSMILQIHLAKLLVMDEITLPYCIFKKFF